MSYIKKGEHRNTGKTWFKKGYNPWNKGKKLGKNPEHSKRMKGKTSWRKGKKHSEESKKKMSEHSSHYKYWLGKKRPDISKENHYNWKGGISNRDMTSPEYKRWRLSVFTRDNFTCLNCKKVGGNLEAHHIKRWCDYPELRFDVNNGATLCKDCHNLTK